ncbi:MAG: hypothetical protein WC635_09485 [Bacteriovorax sp.]|jgi:hypothetical protein
MKLKLILIFFFSINCFSQSKQEVLESSQRVDYQIDWKYKSGNYLIFDCERSHYACVTKDGDDNCREERNFAIEKKLPTYPCAPLRKFTTKATCMIKNYEVVDTQALRRFCYPK